MEQFVKQINNADEDSVNKVIKQQLEKGYKAISVASSNNNWGLFTVVVLFEKIENQTETK